LDGIITLRFGFSFPIADCSSNSFVVSDPGGSGEILDAGAGAGDVRVAVGTGLVLTKIRKITPKKLKGHIT